MNKFYKDIASYDDGAADSTITGLESLLTKVDKKVTAPRTLMRIPFYLAGDMCLGISM